MARNPHMSGKIGPVITYVRNGQSFSRSKPGKVRQSAATKKRSKNFSIASTLARITRLYLQPIFSWKDGTRYNRLTGAFSLWLKGYNLGEMEAGEIPHMKEFAINPPKQVGNRLRDQFSVVKNSKGVEIRLHAFKPNDIFRLPNDTTTMVVKISSLVIRNPLNPSADVASSTITILYNTMNEAKTMQHNLAIGKGCIILTGYSIACLNEYGQPVKLRSGYTFPAGMLLAEWMGKGNVK